MKSILSFLFGVSELFSQLQNDIIFIKIDQGIQILQLKKDWQFVSLYFLI